MRLTRTPSNYLARLDVLEPVQRDADGQARTTEGGHPFNYPHEVIAWIDEWAEQLNEQGEVQRGALLQVVVHSLHHGMHIDADKDTNG